MKQNHFQNKRKIINDPVYGFITIPDDLVFDLMEHPFFQRLRGIKQLGLTFYVYPGAVHTRLQHALGSVYLMNSALGTIKDKGYALEEEDWLGALVAILLHDVGHGPFSHALENVITHLSHEKLSIMIMEQLNQEFGGRLSNAIQIFSGEHELNFLHQLVSSQLDMDRLDYLRRDSYFTGVSEGVIGSERIIKMLRVVDDQLVVDKKGIYSIEKFLIARRLMYWQVYLHKTVTVAEQMLIKVLQRARHLVESGKDLDASQVLHAFLSGKAQEKLERGEQTAYLYDFAQLDDNDVFSALKTWSSNPDPLLAELAQGMMHRKLLAIRIQDEPFDEAQIYELQSKVSKKMKCSLEEASYLVFSDTLSNSTYSEVNDQVMLWENPGRLVELSHASDIINYSMLSKARNKYFLCFPKWLSPEIEQ